MIHKNSLPYSKREEVSGKKNHETKQLEEHNFQQSVNIGQRVTALPLVIIEVEYCNLESITSCPKSYASQGGKMYNKIMSNFSEICKLCSILRRTFSLWS